MKKTMLLCLLSLLVACSGFGNGVAISNLSSVSGAGFVQLQFDVTWSNSWRTTTNYDAVWVFFKWKDNDSLWKHLNLTGANNVAPAGYTITVAPDYTGAMIYRTNNGSGVATANGVKLGVTNYPGSFDVKAFAIEMVQIPLTDTYYLGDGESGTYYSNAAGAPFFVNTPTITLGVGAGLLDDGINNGTLNSGFPIGYAWSGSLYMMKHEISQAGYRDFLNTLSYTQQATRTVTAPSSAAGTQAFGAGTQTYRSALQIMTPGIANSVRAVYGCNLNNNGVFNEAADGEWIACGYLTYMDLAAFLDWAALRPMTEMEFEKSCRGPIYPVSAEAAWGSTAAAGYTYPLTAAGTANESAVYSGSVLNGNVTYNSTAPSGNSPLRVGIHATANATRVSAGAGYYGNLDLSGNIAEFTVTSGNNAGRSYTGVNGDGMLTVEGNANQNYWPGINGNTTVTTANTAFNGVTGVTGAAGCIERGGSAMTTGFNLNKVSYRINPPGTSSRNQASGGRGVKSF